MSNMAWRALCASAAGFLKPSHGCIQQPAVRSQNWQHLCTFTGSKRSMQPAIIPFFSTRTLYLQAAETLQIFAARLLSSASDAHGSSEAGPSGMGTGAGAAVSDTQQERAASADSGSASWNSERREHNGASGDRGDRRRRTPRFGRNQLVWQCCIDMTMMQRVARTLSNCNRGAAASTAFTAPDVLPLQESHRRADQMGNRGHGHPFREDETPRAKIKVLDNCLHVQ